MRVLQLNVYTVDELKSAAKERARQWWRTNSSPDLSFVIDDAKNIGGLMGLQIDRVMWSGFGSQGDGASFTGTYRHQPYALRQVRSYAPRDKRLHDLAKRLQDLQISNRRELRASITRHSSNYCHEYTMAISSQGGIHGAHEALTEIFREFARWIFQQLQAAYEHDTSDAVVDETLIVNGYEFTEQGKRV